MLFAISNRGLSVVDAANPLTLSAAAPTFAALPASIPSEGPSSGGTSLTLTGQNFSPDSAMKIGAQFGVNVSAPTPTTLQATSPASVSNGPANISVFSPSTDWLAVAPEAFSYGPKILRVLPNAGVNTGGDTVEIVGHGFGSDPGGVAATVGGAPAIVQAVDNISAIAPSLGLDISYPFPLERITLQTPPGTPGWSDVIVKVPSGSATAARSFQYLTSAQSYSKPAFFRFLPYDQNRQRVYLTNIDHVDVFDLRLGTFIAPLEPPGGPPPNAGLRGLSFVGLSAEGGSGSSCATCLAQMDLSVNPPVVQTPPQPEVSSLLGRRYFRGAAATNMSCLPLRTTLPPNLRCGTPAHRGSSSFPRQKFPCGTLLVPSMEPRLRCKLLRPPRFDRNVCHSRAHRCRTKSSAGARCGSGTSNASNWGAYLPALSNGCGRWAECKGRGGYF